MQIHTKSQLATVALLAGLFATSLFGAHSAAAQPAQQSSDLISKVQAAFAALKTGDKATLAALLDPSFQDVTTNWPANTPSQLTAPYGRDAFLGLAGKGIHDTLANCTQPGADTVQCDVTLASAVTPQLPHPFTETAVFRFSNGKIVRYEETLSATTASDLSALFAQFQQHQQPGMPTTGRPDGAMGSGLLFSLLACGGLLLAVGGAFLRRRGYSRY